ncbi:hypothetical protein AGDE_03112 [Angomonas deanei]|uniref:Complex1_LYR-like/Complex 1 protein (LYR family), putative n=1 Tax=Angomonas deanei TaxID=59799 RepID=A0A7G2CIF9_9TRYP|nr:hypothetical protein AGDE_03112 [Angomonas deanei]CAD2219640.1 Complex1_LYR-like/Complex 1 protein (LYR family), putative [Angomonas deanei]|eukprot:EPY40814.1 hypothetical protein AGDE_03112 [Angomonas deanei]
MSRSIATYRYGEKISLYRQLLKGANKFPLKSRRDLITEEIRSTFRDPKNEILTEKQVDYRLLLGKEKALSINTYAENMYWFHSRDEVNKEMIHFSIERDKKKIKEMEHFREVSAAPKKTDEVVNFKSAYYHVHPDYYNKIDAQPLTHSRDIWRARGQYGSDVGGPRQKFFVRRFKALFPQGW